MSELLDKNFEIAMISKLKNLEEKIDEWRNRTFQKKLENSKKKQMGNLETMNTISIYF